ncbi:hypothetical protein C8R45DRAFT_197004 [Mycena sanguinolenta]|nr:hypothetical protein C8R45DRAFT_197004 [Mycena sanguinolenta]
MPCLAGKSPATRVQHTEYIDGISATREPKIIICPAARPSMQTASTTPSRPTVPARLISSRRRHGICLPAGIPSRCRPSGAAIAQVRTQREDTCCAFHGAKRSSEALVDPATRGIDEWHYGRDGATRAGRVFPPDRPYLFSLEDGSGEKLSSSASTDEPASCKYNVKPACLLSPTIPSPRERFLAQTKDGYPRRTAAQVRRPRGRGYEERHSGLGERRVGCARSLFRDGNGNGSAVPSIRRSRVL